MSFPSLSKQRVDGTLLTSADRRAVSKWDNNDMYIPGGPKKRPELLHGSVLGENSYRHIRRCLLITYMLFC